MTQRQVALLRRHRHVPHDEENVLRSLVRLFRRDGYHVLTAGSAREAFDLLTATTAS